MKKEPSVTIFVPVKNAKSTIEQCIDSLLNLSYKNKKIFVVDNMSTDGTYEILKTYGRKIHLNRMSGTVPKMHNSILKKAKSNFIAYTNSDCVVKKNWLNKLISSFTSNDVVATTGYCSTPKGLNKLQTIIGKELEDRFKNAPKFVPRGPDMNLCVRTDAAKKVMFDERFIWSWESDFGYRLTRLGRMKFVPDAIVYHYHRPSWLSFFRQQFNNAVINELLYWKHKEKVLGDHLSTTSMAFTLGFAYLTVFFAFLSLFNTIFIKAFFVSFWIILLLYFRDILRVSRNLDDIPTVLGILVIRTVAWMFGVLVGLFLFFKRKWYKRYRE